MQGFAELIVVYASYHGSLNCYLIYTFVLLFAVLLFVNTYSSEFLLLP